MLQLDEDAAAQRAAALPDRQRVLALDPGSLLLGWAILSMDEKLLAAGTEDTKGWSLDRFTAFALSKLGDRDIIAIEGPGLWIRQREGGSVGVRAVMMLHRIIGAVSAIPAIRLGHRVIEWTARDVKLGIAGSSTATKAEVHFILQRTGYVLPQHRAQTCADCRRARPDAITDAAHSPDAADAIALGLYAIRRLLAPDF